jgi:hypothetical protein
MAEPGETVLLDGAEWAHRAIGGGRTICDAPVMELMPTTVLRHGTNLCPVCWDTKALKRFGPGDIREVPCPPSTSWWEVSRG